jgi:hypothetical protein
MERKRIYKLKWIRARRKLHDLLHQMLQMNKKLKQLSSFKTQTPDDVYQDKIRHINSMLKQQYALVRFYEEKVKSK